MAMKVARCLLCLAVSVSLFQLYFIQLYTEIEAPAPGLQNEASLSRGAYHVATADPINRSSFPLEVLWKKYIKQHGQSSLEESLEGRKFVVGYFSCPNQAGNRMHDFFNSMILAVAINRTLLWKYFDPETCRDINHGYNPEDCNITNWLPDCERVLERASWLPSYDYWAPKLGLPARLGPRNPDYRIGGHRYLVWDPSEEMSAELKKQGRTKDDMTRLEMHPSIPNRFEQPVIQTSREWFQDAQTSARKVLMEMEKKRDRRVQTLFQNGTDFLYGMMFHDSFRLREEWLPRESALQVPAGVFTIGMHSRHPKERQTGIHLNDKEESCLESVIERLRKMHGEEAQCLLLLMSDREATLDALTALAYRKRCLTIVASHINGEGNKEHGPYAGIGFYQDLLVAGKARDGFVGHCHRSSSQMLKESIHYEKSMDKLDGKDQATPKVTSCCLNY